MSMNLTDDAREIADKQPIIDVEPVGAGVDYEHPTTVPARRHGPEEASAIEQAANAALLMPGVPGRDEFLALAMTARILSMSAAAPKAVQANPHLAFHIAMIGRDLGISPSAALELIDVIEQRRRDGNIWVTGYQLSLSPQLLNGQIRRLGLGMILPLDRAVDRAVAMAVGPRGIDPRCSIRLPDHVDGCRCDVLGVSEFTWDDARMAGLVGPDCEPGAHAAPVGDKKHCPCNQGYRTYPKRMMWWRAAGFAADDFFPEAGLGLYSPEALGAVVDDAGRPIDPSTVELPAGYDPDEGTRVAPDDVQARIKASIRELPPPAVTALATAWAAPTGEKDGNGVAIPRLWPLKVLPTWQIEAAEELVAEIRARAVAGEFGAWAGHTPATGAASDPGPDSAGESPEAQSGPPSPVSGDDDDPDEDLHCDAPGCGELVVLIGDDGTNWCEQHQPL